MEAYDPEKTARVWQRVRGEDAAAPSHQGLPALIAQEQTDASAYLLLSRRFQGKQSLVLRRMSEEAQAHAACLRGICTLVTGRHPDTKSAPLPQEGTEAILRRCYGRQMQRVAQYEARSADPEYGQVYARLAAQGWDRCRQILELLGSLKQK